MLLRAAGRSFCVGYEFPADPGTASWKHDALKWHD